MREKKEGGFNAPGEPGISAYTGKSEGEAADEMVCGTLIGGQD